MAGLVPAIPISQALTIGSGYTGQARA